jgi:phage terminase small subunit
VGGDVGDVKKAKKKPKKKDDKWDDIRKEYESSKISYRKLAEKYEVSFDTLQRRAKRESWVNNREKIYDKVTTKVRQKMIEKIVEKNVVTSERILEEYAKIGFSDIKDFISYRTEKSTLERHGEQVIDYRQIIDTKSSDDVDGSIISEVSVGKDGTFKFKLHDKMNALEKMAKTLGMLKDKMELTGKDGGAIETKSMTKKEVLDELALLGIKVDDVDG